MRIMFFLGFALFLVLFSSDLLAISTPFYWQTDDDSCSPSGSAPCYAPMNRTVPGAQQQSRSAIDGTQWHMNVTSNYSSAFLYDTNISGSAQVTLFCNATTGTAALRAHIFTVRLFNISGSDFNPSATQTQLLSYQPPEGRSDNTASRNCTILGSGAVTNRKNYPLGTVSSTTILKPGDSLRLWINASIFPAVSGSRYLFITSGGSTQANLTIQETIHNGTLQVNVSDPPADVTDQAATGTALLNASLWCTPGRSCVDIFTELYMCSDTAAAGAGCNPSADVPLSGSVYADSSNKGVGYLTSADTTTNISYIITFNGAEAGTTYRFKFGANSTENGINQSKNSSIIRNFTIATVMQQINMSINEKITLSESYPETQNIFRSKPEKISMLDSYPELQNLFRASPETVSTAETQEQQRKTFGSVGELVNLGEILDRMTNLFRVKSETANTYDSGGKMRSVYQTNSELLSLNDIAGRIMNMFRANAEAINILDSGGKIRNVYLSQNELVSVGDIAGRIANFFRLQSETISIYDVANKAQGGVFLLTVPETIIFFDSGNNAKNVYQIQSELISLNGIADRIRSLFRAQPEVISAYDSGMRLRNVYNIQSELININDIADRLLNIFRTPSQTVSIPDGGGKTRSIYNAQSESISLNDIGSRLLNIFRTNGETVSIVDSGIKIRYAYNNQTELINVYAASSAIKNLFRANGDALTITDSSGKTVYIVKTSQDQISVYDSDMKLRSIYILQSELLSFGDIANRIISLFRAQGETINVYDIAGKTGGIQNILRSILENIGISDSSTARQILFKSSSDILSLNDIADRIRSLLAFRGDAINVLDSEGKLRSVQLSGSELLNLNDIAGRIMNLFRANSETASTAESAGRTGSLFRAQGETASLLDSISKARGVYKAQNELLTVFDADSVSRNFYRIGSELINFNDIANRLLNLFRLQSETVSVYDFATKQRLVNITSFTAQSSLYQNQYQTFDLTLNNTGQENVAVDYNITIFNSAGSAAGTVSCPAATCPYNLAVGQSLISTTSWFTVSNAVGSYTAQATVFHSGTNVSKNVSFSIIATPSQQQQQNTGSGGSSGASAVVAPVTQQIEYVKKGEHGISSFPVLREILAGESISLGFRFTNPHGHAHEISVSINGLPASWVTISPERQEVPANSEKAVNILIATPANIVPADYRVETSVTSDDETVSKTFFIMRVKNTPDIMDTRPVVNREIKIDESTNTTEMSIFVRNGKNPVQMTRITERIPKSLAQNVADVSFDTEPTKVIEKDPVVQWDFVFNPGEEDAKIIKYSVKKVLDDYSQYVYWNLEQMSVYPYLAGALPFSFKSSASTLAKDQFNSVAIEFANDGNSSFEATLSFGTPEGWVIVPKDVTRTVKPGESGRFPFEIKPEIAADGPHALTLKAVIDKKTYSQRIDFYVTSFRFEQLVLPVISAIVLLALAYMIVKAASRRRSRPNISHVINVMRNRQ